MRRTVGTEIKNQILHQNAKKTNKQKKTLKWKSDFDVCNPQLQRKNIYYRVCICEWTMLNYSPEPWLPTEPFRDTVFSCRGAAWTPSACWSLTMAEGTVCVCVCVCVYVCVVFSMMKALTALLETLLHVCPAILPSGASVIIYGKCRLFFQVALYRFVLYIHK